MRRAAIEGAVDVAEPVGGAERSAWRMMLDVFLQSRLGVAGLVIVVAILLFSFVGPLVYQTDQVHTDLAQSGLPPGGSHPLGTDDAGYDQLGRLMVGGQTALKVGLAAALMATTFGAIWGAVAGFLGGAVDAFMMRVVDAGLAIPSLFLLLLLASITTPSELTLIFIIALTAWLGTARLVRAETLTLRVRDYVQAVRVMGGGAPRIVGRHILPNAIGTIVVTATFQIADAIIAVAALSFLGLGIPAPDANWGSMLSKGVTYTQQGYWWLIYPPGVAIVLTVIAFNFMGDALRDAFEVRLQRR